MWSEIQKCEKNGSKCEKMLIKKKKWEKIENKKNGKKIFKTNCFIIDIGTILAGLNRVLQKLTLLHTSKFLHVNKNK